MVREPIQECGNLFGQDHNRIVFFLNTNQCIYIYIHIYIYIYIYIFLCIFYLFGKQANKKSLGYGSTLN